MNRAERAIQFLEEAPNHSLHSYELASLMREDTNFVPRAVNEAQKILAASGLKIASVPEVRGRTRGARYTIVTLSNEPLLFIKPKTEPKVKLEFDRTRNVYIQTVESNTEPSIAVQPSFL